MSGHDGVLELIDLRRSFGSTVALDGLSFTVPPGQVFGFLGPNGAGKTTAMRAIAGTICERAVLRTGARLKVRQVLRPAS